MIARRASLTGAALVFAGVAIVPLAMMLANSLISDGRFSFDAYARVFSSPLQQWDLMANSLVISLVTAALALAIGVPLALLLGKTDVAPRRVLLTLLTIPLLVPPYILAVSWFNVLRPEGLLGKILPASVTEVVWKSLFGLPGCVLVLVSALMPIVLILTMASLRTVNPRLEEAGKLIAGWGGVLRYVTLPMVLPAIVFGIVLVFLLSMGEVGVPMFLRYPVFPVQSLIQFSAFYDFGAATAAATPLLAITLLVLLLEYAWLRDRAYVFKSAISAKALPRIPLRRLRIPAALLIGLYMLLTVIVPLLALVAEAASTSAWLDAWTRASDSLARSLLLAAIGATVLMVLGFMLGYLIHHRALPLWRGLDVLTLLLFTLPGSVIGVGLIALWNRPVTAWIYATPIIIVLAYVAQYTALTSRITATTLANIPDSLEDAGQLIGAPWLSRMLHIVIPAAKPGLVAAWTIAFIFCVRDVGVSMLVYPPGGDTLAVRILTLMANGAPSLIASLCLMLIVVALAPVAVLGLLLRRAKLVR